jgi:hypothetical protein
MLKRIVSISLSAVVLGLLCFCAYLFFSNESDTSAESEKSDGPPLPDELPFLSVQGDTTVDEQGEEVFLRGVNFGGFLSFEGMGLPTEAVLTEDRLREELEKRMGKENTDLLFDEYRKNIIQKQDFANAKDAGANFVRLMFDCRYAETGKIEEAVGWAKEAGIYVILDMQAAPGGQNTFSHSNHDGTARLWTDRANRDETVRLWEILAKRFKDEPAVAGYEILNEPCADDNDKLASLYKSAIEAIRRIDQRHIILLDDNGNLDFSVFKENDFGSNLVYVFHVYSEGVFNKVPEYQAFGEERKVPVICNEYGGMELIAFFEAEGIPHAPMHYKLNRDNPGTPFYYLPPDNLYSVWIHDILQRSSDGNALSRKAAGLIDESGLPQGMKDALMEILRTKGTIGEEDIKALGRDAYSQVIGIVEEIQNIKSDLALDAIADTFSEKSREEKLALMESLQTQYWKKGTMEFSSSADAEPAPSPFNSVGSGSAPRPAAQTYGVFIGLEPEDSSRLSGYDIVVIDAAYFTAEDIRKLHESGQTVYSYLNIGSVENFRDYYAEYEPLTLGEYEDWPEERWVDVFRPEWQRFVTGTLAASLSEKNVDGFFLDNADVYYEYKNENIYDGLVSIISGLGRYGLPLIVNGGDTFVTELLENGGPAAELITGVNQETVFTSIDFKNGGFGLQGVEDRRYYCGYLELCKEQGLQVYLTEYASDPDDVEPSIDAYCEENGFLYYISTSLELD